jgi:RNA polymerase sigma factor (sigma-70 family)
MALSAQSSWDQAFEGLLTRLQPRARATLARFRIPPADAEDVLQQTLLLYVERHSEVVDPEAWILTTLRNRCLMYWRKRRRRIYDAVDEEILARLSDPAEPPHERQHVRAGVQAAIAKVADPCRSLLTVRYALDCDAAETASRLGYKPSGIYKVIERCLAALTAHLAACGFAGRPRRGVRSDG